MTAPAQTSTVQQQAAVLAAGYLRAEAASRSKTVDVILSLWRALTSWREPDIRRFAAQAVPLVLGGQQQIGRLTAAQVQQQITAAGRTPRPVQVTAEQVSGAALRNGTDPASVYFRAGEQVWRDLAADRTLTQAVAAGERRAKAMAEMDLQLAKTHAARAVLEAEDEVTGYRRVLTGRENCALCVIASTQRYNRAELMPLHNFCDCNVSPLFGDEGDDLVLDGDLLDAAHDAIADRLGPDAASRTGRSGADYRKLILVRDHGELGPTLTFARHSHQGPGDLQAAAS